MSYSIFSLFPSFFRSNGPTLIDGADLQMLAKLDFGSANGIVAHAGGGQANATPLTATYNEVTTCATDTDSVMLPPAIPGTAVWIINNTGHTVTVFGVPSNVQNGNAGDTIATAVSNTQAATATGVTQLTTIPATYVCTTLGQWKQFLGRAS